MIILSIFTLIMPVVAGSPTPASLCDNIRVRVERPYEQLHENRDSVHFTIRFNVRTLTTPFMYDGHVFLPLRDVVYALGVSVSWDMDTQTITLETRDKTFGVLTVGDGNVLIVNNRAYACYIILSNLLNLGSYWEYETRTVVLTVPLVQYTAPLPEVRVWLPAGGTSYHSRSNCGNMNPENARRTTRTHARYFGYSTCGNCW